MDGSQRRVDRRAEEVAHGRSRDRRGGGRGACGASAGERRRERRESGEGNRHSRTPRGVPRRDSAGSVASRGGASLRRGRGAARRLRRGGLCLVHTARPHAVRRMPGAVAPWPAEERHRVRRDAGMCGLRPRTVPRGASRAADRQKDASARRRQAERVHGPERCGNESAPGRRRHGHGRGAVGRRAGVEVRVRKRRR